MSAAWSLPGFEVEELLGVGASGEVWRARERVSGEVVALKRLRTGADPGAVAALRREAALLRRLDTPYVVRLRAVLGEGTQTVLVLDQAGGGSLAGLLSRRGRLEPGEVVTVAAPLAQALAAAHRRGLVHGDVSPANVLFTADGMPLLTDLGVGRVVGERLTTVDGTAAYVDPVVAAGGGPDPASDVWALAALCHHMLAGTPPHDGRSVADVLDAAVSGGRAPLGLLAPHCPRALVAVVEAALAADPAERPDAEAFGAALQRAQAAAPVRLTGAPPVASPIADVRATHAVPRPVPPPVPPSSRPGRRPSAAALGAAAVVVVLLGLGLTWALSSPEPAARALPQVAITPSPARSSTSTAAPPAPPVPPVPPVSPMAAPPYWRQVLGDLDRGRELAFARGEPALLEQVYAPGSSAAEADGATLAALSAAGHRATGVRHELRDVQQRSFEGDRAALHYVDALAGQDVVDGRGAVVEQRAGRGEAAYDVVLVRLSGSWRIARLSPA